MDEAKTSTGTPGTEVMTESLYDATTCPRVDEAASARGEAAERHVYSAPIERFIASTHTASRPVSRHPYFLAIDVATLSLIPSSVLAGQLRSDLTWWKVSIAMILVHTVGYNVYLRAKKKVTKTRARSTIQDLALAIIPQYLLACWLLGQPIGPGSDYLGICLPVLLVIYRIGCLVGGCCYGRPNPKGIRYRPELVGGAATRFRTYDPGPCPPGPVTPLQLVDAAAHLAALTAVILIALRDSRLPLLPAYLLAYCLLRIPLDSLRGHRHRPVYGALSESQWAALIVASASAIWLIS